jgi:hypothetical protein
MTPAGTPTAIINMAMRFDTRTDLTSGRPAIKEFAAPALVLDISVESNVPLKEVSPSTDDFFTVSSDPVEINGLPGERIKYHWKSNGELAFIEIHVDRASFRFDAGPDPGDFYATPWWQIISTFRFVDS